MLYGEIVPPIYKLALLLIAIKNLTIYIYYIIIKILYHEKKEVNNEIVIREKSSF